MKTKNINWRRILAPVVNKALLCLSIALCFSGCKKEQMLSDVPSANDNTSKTDRAGTSATPDFTVVVLPDTQYYTHPDAPNHPGGKVAMLQAQIDWVRANRASENIVYVAGVGDIVNHANEDYQWTNAKNCFYRLEPPTTPAYTNNDGVSMPHGIPYGLAVGNHDQYPSQDPSGASTSKYNAAFGVSRFQGRTSYYGGHYGSNNDSHYDLFSVGTGADKVDFIVIFIEYSNGYDWANVHAWVNTTLQTYSTRRAIIVSHNIANLNTANDWSEEGQGLAIYNAIKGRPNVFMMACGHVTQEHVREDTYNSNTIRTYLCDYQGWTNGGDGYMRVMKFSPANNSVSVKSISPYRQNNNQSPWEYTDANSKFTKPMIGHAIDFDTFADGVGHFFRQPTYSGSTKGVATTSTATRYVSGTSTHLQVTLNDLTGTTPWFVRLLSGDGLKFNNTPAPKSGHMYFWMKSPAVSGAKVRIWVDDVDGTTKQSPPLSVNVDPVTGATRTPNTWYKYDWDLSNNTGWTAVTGTTPYTVGPQVTLDAIILERPDATSQWVSYIDDVGK